MMTTNNSRRRLIEVSAKAGEALGVDQARCFSGLSGFRKPEFDLTGLKA